MLKLIGKNEPSILQNDIQFTETIIESSIQALTTVYVLMVQIGNNVNLSPTVFISFMFSMSSIMGCAATQDKSWFTAWCVDSLSHHKWTIFFVYTM